jgi:hypothetical protein
VEVGDGQIARDGDCFLGCRADGDVGRGFHGKTPPKSVGQVGNLPYSRLAIEII